MISFWQNVKWFSNPEWLGMSQVSFGGLFALGVILVILDKVLGFDETMYKKVSTYFGEVATRMRLGASLKPHCQSQWRRL